MESQVHMNKELPSAKYHRNDTGPDRRYVKEHRKRERYSESLESELGPMMTSCCGNVYCGVAVVNNMLIPQYGKRVLRPMPHVLKKIDDKKVNYKDDCLMQISRVIKKLQID